MSAILAAMMTGLLGSLHCAAMCGPLAVAGCRTRRDAGGYFLGRALSYATVGAALGVSGRGLLHALPFAWAERIALGLVAVAVAWRGLTLLRPRRALTQLGRPSIWRELGALLPRRGLALGLATGLLPCGLLIPAWLLAASTESAPLGAAVMLAFALASTGGLLAPLLGRPLLDRISRQMPARAHAAAWLLLAAFLAVRPFLVATHHCH